MLVSNEETWLALLPWVSKNSISTSPLNIMSGFFLLFNVTMDISLSHAPWPPRWCIVRKIKITLDSCFPTSLYMRYQESDLYLGLYSSSSSYNVYRTQRLFQFHQLHYSSLLPLTSSSIVEVLIAKAGHVWVSWLEEFLLYILSLTLQQVCYC